MKKTLLTSLLVLPLALFSQTLDQSQTDNSDALDIFIDPSEYVYQSFKAGITGELTSVELSFESTQAEDLVVEIYSGSFEDNNLGLTPLGSSIASLSNTDGFVTVNFSKVEVVSGNKYSIKINLGSNFQFTQGTVDDSYPDGVHTDVYGNTENTGDLYFKTFVEPATVTGVTQTLADNVLNVYPNPCTSDFIKFTSVVNNIEIYNVRGELILNTTQADKLSVSQLKAGLYHIKTNQGSAKLMIQ